MMMVAAASMGMVGGHLNHHNHHHHHNSLIGDAENNLGGYVNSQMQSYAANPTSWYSNPSDPRFASM
jgi:hypothetical protein